MLVGIYTRVSTQEQATEGYSLQEQEERLKAYCIAKGWTIGNIYTDGGFSGGNTDRPGLQKMINDIKRKKIDTVLVYKLDRLSRSQKDTLNLIEDIFNKNNVAFERANHLVNKISSSERYNVSKYTKYLLTGLVYCGKCGLRFGTQHKRGTYKRKDGVIPYHYVYYGCYARLSHKGMAKGIKCNNPLRRIEDLDTLVINEIKKLQFNRDYLEELAGVEKENNTAENIKILKEKIKEYNKQLDKLMDLYQLENIPLDVIANKIKAVSEAKDNVEVRISELEKENTTVDMDEVRKIISSASEILDGDDPIKKRVLVRSLIDRIVVDDDKVTIYWSFS